MSNVTAADVNFMRDLQTIVEGGNVSLNSAPPNPSYGGHARSNVGFTPDNPSMYLDDMKKYMRIVEGIEENNISPTTKSNYNSGNYEVVVDLNESGRIYYIKDMNRNIFKDKTFTVFEAAMGICKSLNGECNTTINYINEFINLDDEFSAEKEKAMEAKKNHSRAIQVNESRAASIFENNFKRHQTNANEVYSGIKSLFEMAIK